MSVSDERTTQPAVQPAAAASGIADPAPLGLAAFALTTFLLSAANAGWMTRASGDAWLSYAFAYGGLVQLLAGMWEFRNRNVFGATAFSTYGAFWIGLFLYVRLVVPPLVTPRTATFNPSAVPHDLGWILLAFAIFNLYMLILSTQTSLAVFGVFLTLQVTEIILFIGNFTTSSGTIKAGGYVGVLTALVAWYASAGGVSNGLAGRFRFPLGKPLLS